MGNMERKMRSHQRLDVWKEAMRLVKEIYAITAKFPEEEKYGLTSQMRRAAVSIPSNISEGAAMSGSKEFLRFLYPPSQNTTGMPVDECKRK